MRIHIIGGGTVFHVRPHLAISAPAYGETAREIHRILSDMGVDDVQVNLTRMASQHPGVSDLETNQDIDRLLTKLTADPTTKIIFMNAALCDFEGSIMDGEEQTYSGKSQPRLTSDQYYNLRLTPADKIIRRIREVRKDIFLVGFKTTAGKSPTDQYLAGLNLLKKSSCNLVLANDIHTRLNQVITPEQSRYHETTDRKTALRGLVEMTLLRSKLHFTRSQIVPGEAVRWDSDVVPDSLRTVVNHMIARGAYKPFNNATVGHFAYKVDDTRFVTSRRKVDFNKLSEIGMVMVEAKDRDSVVAHGFRPSVGGMSQRIIFSAHPELDCIVHAHVPLRPGADIPIRSQREFECGSHECGQNTSDGLENFDGIRAVMLDQHGPNVVFNRSMDPRKIIDFIEKNFDLGGRTDNI